MDIHKPSAKMSAPPAYSEEPPAYLETPPRKFVVMKGDGNIIDATKFAGPNAEHVLVDYQTAVNTKLRKTEASLYEAEVRLRMTEARLREIEAALRHHIDTIYHMDGSDVVDEVAGRKKKCTIL